MSAKNQTPNAGTPAPARQKPTNQPRHPRSLGASPGSAIDRQMRYLSETDARLHELKIRAQNAKHWVRRRIPAHADDELTHLIAEAQKLRLHLAAWQDYVIPPNNLGEPCGPKADSVTKSIDEARNDATYGQVVPAYFCREIEREEARLRDAIALELIENRKLQKGATIVELELFAVAQERRLRELLG